jgi:hypothetical protein
MENEMTNQIKPELPPLPWGDDIAFWLEVHSDSEIVEAFKAYALSAIALANSKTPEVDRLDRISERLANSKADTHEFVAYAEDGALHWLTGRKFDNCKLYTRPAPAAPIDVAASVESIGNDKRFNQLVDRVYLAGLQKTGSSDREVRDLVDFVDAWVIPAAAPATPSVPLAQKSEGFDCSLAAAQEYDPQSFIHGVNWARKNQPATPSNDKARIKMLEEALQFYANGDHFTMHDSSAWDTVSGEPPNFYEDESNTATVEDGSIAKMVLAGTAIPDDDAAPQATQPEAAPSEQATKEKP